MTHIIGQLPPENEERVELMRMTGFAFSSTVGPRKWVEANLSKKNPTLVEIFLPDEVKELLDETREETKKQTGEDNDFADFETLMFTYIMLEGMKTIVYERISKGGLASMSGFEGKLEDIKRELEGENGKL